MKYIFLLLTLSGCMTAQDRRYLEAWRESSLTSPRFECMEILEKDGMIDWALARKLCKEIIK